MEKAAASDGWSEGEDGGINKLSDDLLITILSHTSLEESARASVLARRWRYMWTSAHRTLLFDYTDSASGNLMEEKFKSFVNSLEKNIDAHYIQGLVISFKGKGSKSQSIFNSLVYFAMQKEVERFELNLLDTHFHNKYKFPSVNNLVSNYHGIKGYPFSHLRTFRLSEVDVKDEVVHYILASCPNLEEMSIHVSNATQKLRVIDTPRLRVLEISECWHLESLEICAPHLMSLTYRGPRSRLALEKIPNLREVSIQTDFYKPFITEPELWSFSGQLEKLVLDFRFTGSNCTSYILHNMHQSISFCSLKRLEIFAAEETLIDFIPLIMASPQLREFRIEISHSYSEWPPFEGRNLRELWKEMNLFVHGNLKVVEVGGYKGIEGEQELVRALIMIGPSIERVVIDTEIDYFDIHRYNLLRRQRGLECFRRRTETERDKAKERAKQFFKTKKFPRHIKSIVI